jgi:glutaredoxin
MKIIAYIKTGCPWCIGVTDYFKEKGIDFEIKNVTEDPSLFNEMQELSGQTKAPVVIIDGYMLADTDREAVDKYLSTKK